MPLGCKIRWHFHKIAAKPKLAHKGNILLCLCYVLLATTIHQKSFNQEKKWGNLQNDKNPLLDVLVQLQGDLSLLYILNSLLKALSRLWFGWLNQLNLLSQGNTITCTFNNNYYFIGLMSNLKF